MLRGVHELLYSHSGYNFVLIARCWTVSSMARCVVAVLGGVLHGALHMRVTARRTSVESLLGLLALDAMSRCTKQPCDVAHNS
jgi:hypothetical protein